MKYLFLYLIFSFLIISSYAQFNYPATRTVDSSDTWHNITIKDPYRWLEDLKSEETKNWFQEQNNFTNNVLQQLPLTDQIYKEFIKFDSIQTDNVTRIKQTGNTFYYFNLKANDAQKIMYKRVGENGKEEIFTTSNMWGTDYQLNTYDIDPSEQFMVITATKSGNERAEAKFYSLTQNKFLTDSIPGLFAGFAPGNGNIYYQILPTYDVHQKIEDKDRWFKIHKIGTSSNEDKIHFSYQTNPEFYSLDNKARPYPVWPGNNFNYELIHYGSVSPFREIYYRKINSNEAWKKLINFSDEITPSITGYGNKLFFISKKNAPNGKMMMLDLSRPNTNISQAVTVADEKEIPLVGFAQTKNFIILPYLKNGVQSIINILDIRNNKITKSGIEENTNITLLTPYNLSNDDVLISRYGWATPSKYSNSSLGIIPQKEKKLPFRKDIVYAASDEIIVEEIEIPSHDGVLVPVSIIYKKGLKMNGKNPTYVYGYGAYGTSMFAGFNPDYLQMVNMGVVIVISFVSCLCCILIQICNIQFFNFSSCLKRLYQRFTSGIDRFRIILLNWIAYKNTRLITGFIYRIVDTVFIQQFLHSIHMHLFTFPDIPKGIYLPFGIHRIINIPGHFFLFPHMNNSLYFHHTQSIWHLCTKFSSY